MLPQTLLLLESKAGFLGVVAWVLGLFFHLVYLWGNMVFEILVFFFYLGLKFGIRGIVSYELAEKGEGEGW